MTGGPRTICLGLVVLVAAVGCTSRDVTQPPVVHYGEDLCEHCNMIVSDERFAAALVLEAQRGRYRDLLFDDVGCLVDYLADHPDEPVAATWVRDYGEDGWLPAEQASYLWSEQLHTPMLSGLAAMSSPQQVAAAAADYPGKLLDFGSLASRSEDPQADSGATME